MGLFDKLKHKDKDKGGSASPKPTHKAAAPPVVAAPVPPPKPKPKVDAIDTIQKLRDNIELADKKEAKLQKDIDKLTAEAQKWVAEKNVNRAKQCLARKKLYQNQLNSIVNQRMNLEQQIITLESTVTANEMVNAMDAGNQALGKLQQEVNVDKVDDVMADMQNAIDDANDIQAALGQTVGIGMDDDDILDELAELEALNMEDELSGISAPAGKVPGKVPGKTPAKGKPAKVSEEDELKALEAQLGM